MRAAAVVQVTARRDATMTRLEIRGRDRRWLIYAPADRTDIALPDEPCARSWLADAAVRVQTIRARASYADLWRLGSGTSLGHIADSLIAFAEAPASIR
jgi:hypothetical protein